MSSNVFGVGKVVYTPIPIFSVTVCHINSAYPSRDAIAPGRRGVAPPCPPRRFFTIFSSICTSGDGDDKSASSLLEDDEFHKVSGRQSNEVLEYLLSFIEPFSDVVESILL